VWALSGFYMVVVDIDTIHGDMLVKSMSTTIAPEALDKVSMAEILARTPGAKQVSVKAMMGQAVLVVHEEGTLSLFDARTGVGLSPIAATLAEQIATYHYAGSGSVSSVSLIESNPPGEIRFSSLPIWRIDFDDAWGSSFYVSPQSGAFVTRRHTLWRVFDFLWMLHIMDYDERENVNNKLLRIFSLAGVTLALSGACLLYFRLKSMRTKSKAG
jgi:hypothetical protein